MHLHPTQTNPNVKLQGVTPHSTSVSFPGAAVNYSFAIGRENFAIYQKLCLLPKVYSLLIITRKSCILKFKWTPLKSKNSSFLQYYVEIASHYHKNEGKEKGPFLKINEPVKYLHYLTIAKLLRKRNVIIASVSALSFGKIM